MPLVYTVPVGYLAIARDLDAFQGVTILPDTIYFIGSVGQVIWRNTAIISQDQYGSWRGRQVFNAGESFAVHSDRSFPFDITISGYLLTAP